ncbi:MAG: hypothetical protein WAU07_04185 [Microgenomates group bacterium]
MSTSEKIPESSELPKFFLQLFFATDRMSLRPPDFIAALTERDMKMMLPEIAKLMMRALAYQYETDGLRVEKILANWSEYITFLNKQLPYPLELIPFATVSVWDAIKIFVGFGFIESLEGEIDAEDVNPERETVLKSNLISDLQQQEIIEFLEELQIEVLDDEIIEKIKTVDWSGLVPEHALGVMVQDLKEIQNSRMFEKLKEKGFDKFDFSTASLLFLFEHILDGVLMSNFAKLLIDHLKKLQEE